MSEILSIEISDAEMVRLEKVAEERQVEISQIVRESLKDFLSAKTGIVSREAKMKVSAYEMMAEFFEGGKLGNSGLGDLSTNKKYLENMGRS